MKKLCLVLSLLLFSTPAFAWQSETGGGVVSANSNVVITSIEATQVLKSDALSNLLGTTQLGGSVNYASFNSGGVLSFKNVTTSRDTVVANSDQYLSWGIVNGKNIRVGLSADNTFVIPDTLTGLGASFNSVQVLSGGILRSSGDAAFVRVSSPTATISTTLNASGDVNFVRVSSPTVTVLSGGIFRSSSDTSLVNVSASNVNISGTLKVSGQTSFVSPIQVIGSTVAGLPNVSAIGVAIAYVTDGNSATDCTAGGGKFPNICLSSGNSTWVDA